MQYGMTPRLMWRILENDLKSELVRRYGADDAADALKSAYSYFRDIVAGIEDPNQGSFYFWDLLRGCFLASVYLGARTLGDDIAPTPDECAALVADIANRNVFCQRMARSARGGFVAVRQRDIQRASLMSQMSKAPYAWRYVFTQGANETGYTLSYRSCGIMRLFQELGVPELMQAACRFPDVWYRLAGIELTRSMCLADGDPCCDFRLRLLPNEKEQGSASA